MKIAGQMSEMPIRMKYIQTQTAYGNAGPSQTNIFTALENNIIMEYRSISMMEKLTDDAESFSSCSLRLENMLKNINPVYSTLLELIERLPSAAVTYEAWCSNLYSLLVDKCKNGQIIMFENDELDGFDAYSQLYISPTRTAGLGSLERREYSTNPQVAKKERLGKESRGTGESNASEV